VRPRIIGILILAAATLPSSAFAQYVGRDKPHAGSVEIGGGFLWDGGYDAGSASANETRNPTTGTAPLQLFAASGRVGNAFGAAGWIDVFVTPRWSVEGRIQFARPKLTADTSNDFEGASIAVIDETLTRYVIDGSVVYQIASLANGHAAPFVIGGGGYTRELDSDNTNVQTGYEIHGGGGLRYWFGSRGSRFGLRVEARVSSRTGIASFESTNKRRIIPGASAGITYLF
jgi:hypothetical protein